MKPSLDDLTKYFIDLSKCSEEQQKHIFSLLPKKQYKNQYKISEYHFILHWIGVWDVVNDDYYNKTELLYPDFIKLLERGEEERKVSFSMDEMVAFGKKCFYKGFDKCETDDANCYTAWREEAGLLIEQIKH